jgi:poly(hydroxyalkanoate) granule-associated protein
MARKSKSRSRPAADSGDAAQAIRDSAQKIWLAGLGAYERARTDGPRVFETLVEQGRSMGARAVGAADEALKSMRQANYSGATQKLEKALEERVSTSLAKLGLLTNRQVEALQRQVQELNETVRRMAGGGASRPKRKSPAAKGRRKSAVAKGGRKKAAGAARKRSSGARKGRAKRPA